MSKKKTKENKGRKATGTLKEILLEHKKSFPKPNGMISEIKISIDKVEKGIVTTENYVLKDQRNITRTNIRDMEDRMRRQDMQKTVFPERDTLMNGEKNN